MKWKTQPDRLVRLLFIRTKYTFFFHPLWNERTPKAWRKSVSYLFMHILFSVRHNFRMKSHGKVHIKQSDKMKILKCTDQERCALRLSSCKLKPLKNEHLNDLHFSDSNHWICVISRFVGSIGLHLFYPYTHLRRPTSQYHSFMTNENRWILKQGWLPFPINRLNVGTCGIQAARLDDGSLMCVCVFCIDAIVAYEVAYKSVVCSPLSNASMKNSLITLCYSRFGRFRSMIYKATEYENEFSTSEAPTNFGVPHTFSSCTKWFRSFHWNVVVGKVWCAWKRNCVYMWWTNQLFKWFDVDFGGLNQIRFFLFSNDLISDRIVAH